MFLRWHLVPYVDLPIKFAMHRGWSDCRYFSASAIPGGASTELLSFLLLCQVEGCLRFKTSGYFPNHAGTRNWCTVAYTENIMFLMISDTVGIKPRLRECKSIHIHTPLASSSCLCIVLTHLNGNEQTSWLLNEQTMALVWSLEIA